MLVPAAYLFPGKRITVVGERSPGAILPGRCPVAVSSGMTVASTMVCTACCTIGLDSTGTAVGSSSVSDGTYTAISCIVASDTASLPRVSVVPGPSASDCD